jgi:hypothetical protein
MAKVKHVNTYQLQQKMFYTQDTCCQSYCKHHKIIFKNYGATVLGNGNTQYNDTQRNDTQNKGSICDNHALQHSVSSTVMVSVAFWLCYSG